MLSLPRLWTGPAGMKEVYRIAFPVFLSQAVDTVMIFTDRFFLAELSQEHLGATMGGGLAAFLAAFFLIGTLGQVTAFVAQYAGAGRARECSRIVDQGFFITPVFTIPLIGLAYWLGEEGFRLAGHSGKLLQHELEYFNVLILVIFASGIRTTFSGFFTGLGHTRVVLWANALGVLVNIPLSYALIFGKWGLPAWGIEGAAWATICSSFLPIGVFALIYTSNRYHEQYQTRRIPRFDRSMARRLLRFGLPSGTEMVINLGAFTTFMLVLQSLSSEAAAAVTIVLNWDIVSALPLMGIGQATMSLVGQYKGAGRLKLSRRAAMSGLRLALLYSSTIIAVYLMFTSELTGLFSSRATDYADVYELADLMLQLSCIYITFDAVYLIFSNVIRGAGDTRFAMLGSTSLDWAFTIATVYLVRQGYLGVVGGWAMLIGLVFALATLFYWRFLTGKWQAIEMIDETISKK